MSSLLQFAAAITIATTANAAAGVYLNENVTRWTADLAWQSFGGFAQTQGLGMSGEIGWHTHGSDDNIDVDMDLALVIGASSPIDPSYTTMMLWGLPVGDELTLSSQQTWEVGALEYKRGFLTTAETWDLTQATCLNYLSGDVLFNANGDQFYDIVSPISSSYVKKGAVQDTAYWSENVLARRFDDTTVVITLSRPSLSNTLIFKAGQNISSQVAMLQKNDAGGKAFGQGEVEWFIVESNFEGAVSSIVGSTALAAFTLMLNLF